MGFSFGLLGEFLPASLKRLVMRECEDRVLEEVKGLVLEGAMPPALEDVCLGFMSFRDIDSPGAADSQVTWEEEVVKSVVIRASYKVRRPVRRRNTRDGVNDRVVDPEEELYYIIPR